MNEKILITINREFGSGGRLIGEALAKKLGIKLIDKMILEEASKEMNMSTSYLEKFEEKAPSIWDNFTYSSGSYHGMSIPCFYNTITNNDLYIMETNIIKELASKASGVFVGRCANYILHQENIPCVSIFLYAPVAYRMQTLTGVYGFNTEKNMEKEVAKIDKQRSEYYRMYTQTEWKDVDNYDLAIDTSKLSVNAIVELITTYIGKLK